MPKYKVSIVETAIYDVYVEADNLDEAINEAAYTDPDRTWIKDVNASSCEVGTDHYVWVDNEWKEAKQ